MKQADMHRNYERYVMKTYTRVNRTFVKGKGMVLTDIDGKKYLDFFPGWGVSNVGHCHPKVMAGVRDQIGKLIHVPNNFYILQQAKLARELIRHSFDGKVFFCNSGAESCEAAIKLARIFGGEERNEIITMKQSFHGRTLGALAATGQTVYQKGFHPLPQGFHSVAFNDIGAVSQKMSKRTAAVILELIQGEGGVHVADKQYIQKLRSICDRNGTLLIFDEVQTGMGRTGQMFAFKNYGIRPDAIMIAKALGGGLPVGALVVRRDHADLLKPGMHASTFGGSPLVCKAALGVIEAIVKEKMLKNCREMGAYLKEGLGQLKADIPAVTDVRGVGLMIGIELAFAGAQVFEECLQRGLIINCTQGNILRLMPALNVTKRQADKALHILGIALSKVSKRNVS